MTEIDNSSNNEKALFWVNFVFSLFIAGWLILIYLSGGQTKGLVGTDGYTHLTRASDLYETANWYHPSPMRTNTPYGIHSHWTRPFDVLLLGGALPLSKLMGFESALFWWGVFISPLLLVITLIVLSWAVKPLMSKEGAFFIIVIVALQFWVMTTFQAARPDHHSFLALLFVLVVGFGLRLAICPFSRWRCQLFGITAALALWSSIESLLVVGLMAAVIGLFWIYQEKDFLKKSWHFSVVLFFSSCACLLLERPLSDIKAAELDRFSIVYCVLFGLMALFWTAAICVDSKTTLFGFLGGRFGYSIMGIAAVALVMWLLFPKFYKGSLADMDPRVIPIWFDYIKELQPIFSKSGSFIPIVQICGSMVVGIGFLVYVLFKKNDPAYCNGWLTLLVLTLAFGFMAFYQVRWLVYPQVLLSIPMAELLCRILTRLQGISSVTVRALAKSGVILVFSTGFLLLGFLSDWFFNREEPDSSSRKISLVSVCEYLAEKTQTEERPLRLLTHGDFASEILYRTNCEVVGTTCHRNAQGTIDNHIVLTAQTDDQALEIIEKRGIDIMILHLKKIPTDINVLFKGTSIFSQRLREGQVPPWLKKVELPENLSEDFLMFETDFNSRVPPLHVSRRSS